MYDNGYQRTKYERESCPVEGCDHLVEVPCLPFDDQPAAERARWLLGLHVQAAHSGCQHPIPSLPTPQTEVLPMRALALICVVGQVVIVAVLIVSHVR